MNSIAPLVSGVLPCVTSTWRSAFGEKFSTRKDAIITTPAPMNIAINFAGVNFTILIA
jgi:hypothetical protein